MDHVVYVDVKSKELEKLLEGTKRMIIRGATGRKIPYGRVNSGDILYLIRNNAEGIIQARATVKQVSNSEKMTKEESAELVRKNQDMLQLTPQQEMRWAGKRYLVLIEIEDVSKIEPFSIDKSEYGNMDDWLPVEDINKVKVI